MTPDKIVESDYARGYKQGKFDAEMDATQYHQDMMSEVVEATEKAFGSCKKCYGKGYSTVLDSITYHADFIGDKTYTKQNNPIRFCVCNRGKQLQALTQPNNPD